MRQIFIVNSSRLVSDEQVATAVAAIQKQVDFDFGPIWNCYATLTALPMGSGVGAKEWFVEVVDKSSEEGALGFHTDEGTPRGTVAVGDCHKDGIPWSSCLSHEILEMLPDPWCQLCYQVGDMVLSLEVCDAVEGAGYEIDGIMVENFVTPDWFREGSSGPWDKRGILKDPLTLLEGGYKSTAKIDQWTQESAERVRASKLTAGSLSRRGRRSRRVA